jgi:hypothetical protein
MSATRNGIAGWLLTAAAALGAAGQTPGQGREGPSGERPEVRAMFKSADAGAGTITVMVPAEGRRELIEKTFALAKDVEVALVSGGSLGRGGVFKEGKLADLAEGVAISLTLSADQHKSVLSILAEGPTLRGQVKAVDANKNTLTVALGGGRGEPGEEKTFTLAADAEVAVDDGRGRRLSIKEAKLTDLAAGALVTVRLSVDKKQAQFVLAEGPTVVGVVKAVDGGKKTLTVTLRPPRGDDAGEDRALTLALDGVVLLDDGRGRRLSVKEGKLADVPVGSAVSVRLSPDGAFAVLVRAEGPTLSGRLKVADPQKGTVTILIPKGRDDPEERTVPVAEGARVVIDGKEAKLADLKATDDGPFVQVRLSLDQKAAQLIMAQQGRSRER